MYYRSQSKIRPTGRERPWADNEIIVTKTDMKGRITYANSTFLRLAQLSEKETLGKPHNLIRHPEMPRCVFKLFWEALLARREIFAFVNNMAVNGDHYWVFAHVTPSFDSNGEVVGYHSNRRKPTAAQIEKIQPLYKSLYDREMQHSSPQNGLEASTQLLNDTLKENGVSYDEFVFLI